MFCLIFHGTCPDTHPEKILQVTHTVPNFLYDNIIFTRPEHDFYPSGTGSRAGVNSDFAIPIPIPAFSDFAIPIPELTIPIPIPDLQFQFKFQFWSPSGTDIPRQYMYILLLLN